MLSRVVLKNFKSVVACDVQLRPLTFLVGLNGAGKSNFIDSLRFCRDALRNPLGQAFANRASNLRSVSHWRPNSELEGFGFRVDLKLESRPARYSFWIGPEARRGFGVRDEECAIGDIDLPLGIVSPQRVRSPYFRVRAGVVTTDLPANLIPTVSQVRDVGWTTGTGSLYLPIAWLADFREVYEGLVDMQFYNPDPGAMKVDLDTSGPADILEPDGSNIASVFDRISSEAPYAAKRIVEYMQRIIPGLRGISSETFKTYKLLNFEQESPTSGIRNLLASNMSDGTLRALAVLVALFQRTAGELRPTVIAIEEPETGLHPAAAGILFDALREGSKFGQVIVSSHSPDLLDNPNILTESILAVDSSSGETEIAPLDETGRSTLHERLYTAGDLLRMDQLKPDETGRSKRAETELFIDR